MGNYDPDIAYQIFQHSHLNLPKVPSSSSYDPSKPAALDPAGTNPWYLTSLRMISNTDLTVNGHARSTWWNTLAALLTRPDIVDEMSYACSSSLGSPRQVDCARLAYSELGPWTDTVQIHPDAPTVLLGRETVRWLGDRSGRRFWH